jgi:hypothetical protein
MDECEPHVVSLRALTKVTTWNDVVVLALREAALSNAPKLGLVIVNSDGATNADIIGARYDRNSEKGHSLWVQAKHYPFNELSELVTMREHHKMGVVTMATYLADSIWQQDNEWMALKGWLERLFYAEGMQSPTLQWQTALMKELAGRWSEGKKPVFFSHLLEECCKAGIKFSAVEQYRLRRRERANNSKRVVLLALVKDATEEGCQEVSPRAWTLKMTEATMTSAFHPLPFLPVIHPQKNLDGDREVECDPESTERLAYVDWGKVSEGAN